MNSPMGNKCPIQGQTFIVLNKNHHDDIFSSQYLTFVIMITFYQKKFFHKSNEFSSQRWDMTAVMIFHPCDEFSSQWWIFIFHQNDEFSSQWWIFISKISFFGVISFHQSYYFSSKWWIFINIMTFINVMNFHQSNTVSPR